MLQLDTVEVAAEAAAPPAAAPPATERPTEVDTLLLGDEDVAVEAVAWRHFAVQRIQLCPKG